MEATFLFMYDRVVAVQSGLLRLKCLINGEQFVKSQYLCGPEFLPAVFLHFPTLQPSHTDSKKHHTMYSTFRRYAESFPPSE